MSSGPILSFSVGLGERGSGLSVPDRASLRQLREQPTGGRGRLYGRVAGGLIPDPITTILRVDQVPVLRLNSVRPGLR